MKVECIHDNWSPTFPDITFPVKGIIYTVRGVYTHGDHTGYYLEEILNPPKHWLEGYQEAAFDIKCFRPITDISVFQKLTKVRELEDA